MYFSRRERIIISKNWVRMQIIFCVKYKNWCCVFNMQNTYIGTGTYNLIRPQLNFFDSLDTGVGLTQPDRVWNNTPAQVCSWNTNNLPYQECGYCVPQCWADRLACLLEVSSQTGEKNARSNSATRKKRVPTSEHYFLPAADIEFIALHKLVSFVH